MSQKQRSLAAPRQVRMLRKEVLWLAKANPYQLMQTTLETVAAEALKLPVKDRAVLAHTLICTLDEEPADGPAESHLDYRFRTPQAPPTIVGEPPVKHPVTR